MRTTLHDELARIGSDRDAGDLEATLDHAHRSLADAIALLDLEVEELWRNGPEVEDSKRYDKLKALIREATKVKSQIIEIRTRIGLGALDEKTALNLEDARDEILRRLARLAADQDQGKIFK